MRDSTGKEIVIGSLIQVKYEWPEEGIPKYCNSLMKRRFGNVRRVIGKQQAHAQLHAGGFWPPEMLIVVG